MKDFDSWNNKKKKIERHSSNPISFSERDVLWCSVGTNIGHEQDGKNNLYERPVLVFKKFNNKLAWVIPATSNNKKSGKYYFNVNLSNKDYNFILSQLKVISSKRFVRFITSVPKNKFKKIKNTIISLISENHYL